MRGRCSIYIPALALGVALIALNAKEAYSEEARPIRSDVDYSSFARILDPRPEALNFTLNDLDGNRVELKDSRGKVVMINFRATW